MQSQIALQHRVRRTVNDLVMAEMFLVQATIESATVIGNGISELGKQIAVDDGANDSSDDSVIKVLVRIVDDAVEPYASRFKYFHAMINADD
jgi:hypothetical protein